MFWRKEYLKIHGLKCCFLDFLLCVRTFLFHNGQFQCLFCLGKRLARKCVLFSLKKLALSCLALHLVSLLSIVSGLFCWPSVRKRKKCNMSSPWTLRTSVATFYSLWLQGNHQRRSISSLHLQFCSKETAEHRVGTSEASWQ